MFFNHIFKYFKIGFIFTFGLLSTLIAQQSVILNDDSDKYLLGMYLEILEDPNGTLSLDSVTAPEYSLQFKPSQEEIPRYGYTESVLWIRLKILNEKDEANGSPWALELGYPNMHYVDLYQLSDEGKVVKMTNTGSMRSIQTRDYPYPRFVFILQLPRHSEQTIYLRFQNEASMTLPLILRSITEFMEVSQETHILNGIFIGILLIMIGYYLFLFFSLKDQSYLYFSLFTISLLLFNLSYTGVSNLYLWPNLVWWNRLTIPLFIGLMNISFLKFTETFLQTKTQMIKLQKIINLLLVVVALFIIITPVVNYRFSIMSMMLLIIISFFLVVPVGYMFYRRGFRPARYFLLSLLPLLLTTLLLILVRWGFLSSNQITEQGYLLGSILFMWLLAFALADRIKLFKTEKYIANKKLKESEEKYRTSFEGSRDGHTIFKMDKKIVDANPKFIEMCGYTKHELIEMSLPDIYPEANRPETVERMKKILSGDEIPEFETIMQTKNGREIPVSISVFELKNCYGEKIVFQSSVRDITERKKTEEDLQISDNNLRALLNATTDVAFLIDTDYKIILLNKALANAGGKSIKEIRGKNALDLLPPELAEQRKKQMDKAFRSGKPIRWEDSGVLGWSDNSVFPVTDAKGNVTNLAVFSLDISERKKAEDELLKSEKQLSFVIKGANLGTWDWDLLTDKINCNDQCFEMLGMQFNEINVDLEMWKSLIHPDEKEKVLTQAYSVVNGETSLYDIEYRIKHKTGKWIWVVTRGKIVDFDDKGQPLRAAGTLIDITNRKYAEISKQVVYNIANAVSNTENMDEFYRTIHKELDKLVEAKNFQVALYDEKKDVIQLPYSSDQFDKYKKIPTRKTCSAYVIKKKQAVLLRQTDVQKLVAEGEIEIFGTPSKIWLGVPLQVDEKIIGLIFIQSYENENAYDEKDLELMEFVSEQIAISITRKQAEEQIRILTRSVEQSPASIVITDLEGNIEYVNPKFSEITGYSFDEVKGKNPRILKSDENPKKIHKQLWKTISSGREWKGEFHNKKKKR